MSSSESTLDIVYAFLTRLGREPTESEVDAWLSATEYERKHFFDSISSRFPPCVRDGELVVLERDPDTPFDAKDRGILLENEGVFIETGDSTDRMKRCVLFQQSASFEVHLFDVRARVADEYVSRRVRRQAVNVERGWFEEHCEFGPHAATVRIVPSQAHPMITMHTLTVDGAVDLHHVIGARSSVTPRVVANYLGDGLVEALVHYPRERATLVFMYELGEGVRHDDTRLLQSGEVHFEFRTEPSTTVTRFDIMSFHVLDRDWEAAFTNIHDVRRELFLQTTPGARIPSLVDKHVVEWRDVLRVPSSVRIMPKTSNDANDVESMLFVETVLAVVMFQSANRTHFIDEDDVYVTPLLIALRPERAKDLLDKRLQQVSDMWPTRNGYTGKSTLGSNKRIYRSALLVFHMWLYHRATSDYGWLFQRIGTMHDLTTYINDHRITGEGFKNVDGVDGVRRNDDIFTDRVGTLALRSTTNAAWRLTFDHYETWEDFDSIPTHMTSTADRHDVDVPYDTLVVDTSTIDGSLVYVWFSRDDFGDQVRVGHIFGEDTRTQMVLRPNTTYRIVRTQRVRQVYPIEILDPSGGILYGLRDEDDVWEVPSDNLGGYRFRYTNNLYQDVVNTFSSIFLGVGAFRESVLPPVPDTREQLEAGASLESLLTLSGIYAWRGKESAAVLRNTADIEASISSRANTQRESKLIVGGLRGSEARAYPPNAYRERKHAIDAANALVMSSHGSTQPWGVDRPEATAFHFLFDIVGVYFAGEMTKDGVVYETFGTEVRNQSILPSYMMSVHLELPYVKQTVYNNLLDSAPLTAVPQDVTAVLKYLPDSRAYEVHPTLERVGLSETIDVFVRVDNGDFEPEFSIAEDTDGARFATIHTELRQNDAVVRTQGGTSVTLYDHDFALVDRTMNVYASTVFGVDEHGHNYMEFPVEAVTVDQRDTVVVSSVELAFSFPDLGLAEVTYEWI